MGVENYLAFCIAALALAIVPGPTITVIIANSLRHGVRAGLLNVAGTQIGFLAWLMIAAFGLEAAVQVMGVWFDVLKWVGAGYLVWLGSKLLRAKGDLVAIAAGTRPGGNFLFQGFIVIISNPKMLVLFGAMIPPFLTQGGDVMLETLSLGGTFMVIALISDTFYAFVAGKAGGWLSHSRMRGLEIVSGLCLIGGGLWMGLKGR